MSQETRKAKSNKQVSPSWRHEKPTPAKVTQPVHAQDVIQIVEEHVVAFQWSALDFHGRFIEVKRSWAKGKLTTPKNSQHRRVDMSRMFAETLASLQVTRKKQTLQQGWKELPSWVFISQIGTMLNPDNFRHRVWGKLLTKAGLRHIRVHDLRHTFASLLIQQCESLAYVKEQMGHHSIRITVNTYGHLVPGGNKAAVDRLDEPSVTSHIAHANPA
jgi:integrase